MNTADQRKGARKFVQTWAGKGYEKGETQAFWLSLLKDVFGVKNPETLLVFEQPVFNRGVVPARRLGFIDAWIPSTRVLIEQKGSNHALDKAQKQSDGSMLTPFQQGKRYADNLTTKNRPRWVIACNFDTFEIHDLDDENPNALPVTIALKDLETEFYRLGFLVDSAAETIKAETKLSVAAGELVGKLYDGLLAQYRDKDSLEVQMSLNKLCVRIVFCLYAEDALLFKTKTQFHDYLRDRRPEDMRLALKSLFSVLDTPEEKRDPDELPALLDFPYVNGGLFSDESVRIPQFTQELKDLLLAEASEGFNWADISPTIFGAVFESTLNPETRRKGGMHYTSVENIGKVIEPLFMDALEEEFAEIMRGNQAAAKMRKLRAFQEKLGALKFLDPACGSGNFLTETYIRLRRLENKVILELNARKGQFDFGGVLSPVKVQISQFYGIEINDFACAVAETALWIAESQMLKETEDIIGATLEFFPLKTNTNIHEGNALRLDWAKIVEPTELSYIMGNPPFSGARFMSKEQKADLLEVFGDDWKNAGDIDYVGSWFKKACDLMQGSRSIRAAFVATNSLTQGTAVANLWAPLLESGAHIDFAWRTFIWDSEATEKAHVHCVIVGFSYGDSPAQKIIFEDDHATPAAHINAYLIDGEDIVASSRSRPLCDVPQVGIGNKPIDGGNYLFTEEEKKAFLKAEPEAEPYFKKWYGAEEFIHGKPRYCLWLGDCSPAKLNQMKHCKARVEAVRQLRAASKSEGTRKLADKPTRFHVENMPASDYIVIPEVSSERRRYIPLGFMTPNKFCSNKLRLMPNATLYHFGVLNSSAHMAWMRTVAGRLKSDYSYSVDIVYNAFVWPQPTEAQRSKIEKTAQAILDARALYPDSSLADLYDETSMPAELRRTHKANDKAVLEAYGFPTDLSEPEIVARMMRLYAARVEEVERQEAVEAVIQKILGKGAETIPAWLEELKAKALNAEITPTELLAQGKARKKQEAAKTRKAAAKAS